MDVKKLVGLLVLALVVFFIITRPVAAADTVSSILNTLHNAANSVVDFFSRLVV